MKKQAEPSDPLDSLIKRVKAAQQIYKNFSQSQVDAIFKAAAAAAAAQRIPFHHHLLCRKSGGDIQERLHEYRKGSVAGG